MFGVRLSVKDTSRESNCNWQQRQIWHPTKTDALAPFLTLMVETVLQLLYQKSTYVAISYQQETVHAILNISQLDT